MVRGISQKWFRVLGHVTGGDADRDSRAGNKQPDREQVLQIALLSQ
jgi:hypothetical protein